MSTELDERSASVVLQLVERQQAWIAELAVRVTARLAGPTPPPDPDSTDPLGRDSIDLGANLVAATLGMTTGGAQTRVDVARVITEIAARVPVGDGGRVHELPASVDRGGGGHRRRAWSARGRRGRCAGRLGGQGSKLGRVSAHAAPRGAGRESGSGARRTRAGGEVPLGGQGRLPRRGDEPTTDHHVRDRRPNGVARPRRDRNPVTGRGQGGRPDR